MNINIQNGYGGGCCGCILQGIGLLIIAVFIVTFCSTIGG